jgi:hypothetical protein
VTTKRLPLASGLIAHLKSPLFLESLNPMRPNPSRQTPDHHSSVTRRLALSLACVLSFAVVGCASMRPAPEETVRKLATQRWQALLAGKFDQSYEFATPAFRKLRTVEFYRTNRSAVPVKWVSAEVLRVDCEAARCKVTVKVISEPRLPGFRKSINLESGIEETWVQEDGQWWVFEKL